MKIIRTDYLIIGSGFGAAAPALRLSEKGHKVLMIEKGKNIRGREDFRMTQDPKYLKQYLKSMSGDNINFTYAEGLGGGSGFYEMVSLRAPSMAFEQKSDNGTPLWPKEINREGLNPYYEKAEKLLNVHQIPIDKIPKSGAAFSMLMKNLGYSCDRARYAVKNCVGSGYCITGCIYGAKQSLHYNYIPQAEKYGLKIMTGIDAESIYPLEIGSRNNYKVICKNESGERITILTRTLILASGTVGTAKLLLKSKVNLPNLSNQLGKNICFNGGVKLAGILPEGFLEGDMFTGMSHPGMISYHFLKSHGITVSSAKPLPLYLMDSKRLKINGQGDDSSWGRDNVALMKLYRKRMIVLYALGFAPQTAEIKYLGGDKFKPHLEMNSALERYYHNVHSILESIFEDNNCELIDVQQFDSQWKENNKIRFSSTHMIGSCRMGDHKEIGVVDSNCEVFGYRDMYITDGAVIPSSLAVNSSLTILANAERVASVLVNKKCRKQILSSISQEPSLN